MIAAAILFVGVLNAVLLFVIASQLRHIVTLLLLRAGVMP